MDKETHRLLKPTTFTSRERCSLTNVVIQAKIVFFEDDNDDKDDDSSSSDATDSSDEGAGENLVSLIENFFPSVTVTQNKLECCQYLQETT